jgi:signal transduction histidine kinase
LKTSRCLLCIILLIIAGGCGQLKKKSARWYTDYDRGYRFHYYKNEDSALQLFSRYVNNPDDSFNKGLAYRYMGEILWRNGDLYGAQDYLNIAIHTFGNIDAEELHQRVAKPERTAHVLDSLDAKLRLEWGAAYHISGNVYLDLKLYDEAINDYNKAVPILKGTDYLFEPLNGKATTSQKKGDFKAAIAVFDSIIALQPKDQLLIARVIDNKAKTKWLQDPHYFALPEFWSVLKMRTEDKDTAGLNASYAHLSDYYQKPNPDSAMLYAQKMLGRALENKNPDDRLEAMDKLIRLSNNSVIKDQWYTAHETLADSLKFARDTTKNRFAKIRYDFQQERANNLALQQDVITQRLLMYALIVLAVGSITGLYFRYAKRRKRMQQESDNAIRDSRLKTSKKVHDVVANGLYGIMNELEHIKTIDREPLITKIEGLYEKSRNISYEEIAPVNDINYDNQVHLLLNAFADAQTKVLIVGNQPVFWSRITASQKHELELILSELMINMKKHSQAKNVAIVFKQENSKALITYKDDGVGFPSGYKFGNGLNNTVSRIKSLNGEVNFGKSEKEGVSIAISFPLEPDKI